MRTQAALYADIDLELSWSERELPERERTKHVHRLHPYLGKFVPQLAEAFLRRHARPGQLVWDPFAGSGTTLVEANAFGARASGCDVSAFNCLLTRVKTAAYEPAELLADVVLLGGSRAGEGSRVEGADASPYLRRWFAPRTLAELAGFRARIAGNGLPRALAGRPLACRPLREARPARRPRLPRRAGDGPYVCHKHRRTCRPVGEAAKFLRRYVRDAVQRVTDFGELRRSSDAVVLHGDARVLDPPEPVDLVVTSPPYPGLIDYHEQHAYAFELLRLERRDDEEIGRGIAGYCEAVAEVLLRARNALRRGGTVVVVVNDRHGLYDGILAEAGLRVEKRLLRHVNRRTGRRRGEYFEEVLIASPALRRRA